MDNTELELRRTIAAAERARALIEDPLLVDAFDHLEQLYTASWKASQNPAERDALWHRTKALENLRADLNTTLNDGVMAQAQLTELRTGTDNL